LKKLHTDEKYVKVDQNIIFKPIVLIHHLNWKNIDPPNSLLEKEGFEFLKVSK
jgi:hypothetical protein